MMRGNFSHLGNAENFKCFASEFLMKIGFPRDAVDANFKKGLSIFNEIQSAAREAGFVRESGEVDVNAFLLSKPKKPSES